MENFNGTIEEIKERRGEICNSILRSLPLWFGIEQAIVDYSKAVESLPTFVARVNGKLAGFISVEFHNTFTSEIHVMAVREEFHRKGVGQALVHAAEEHSQKQGAEMFMVKTLGPSRPNREYDQTRKFYLALGFRPLQEFKTIWDERNPCLIMAKPLTAPPISNSPKILGLENTLLFVKDVKQSKTWYQRLLGIAPSIDMPNFAEFKVGKSALGLHPADEKSPLSTGGQVAYWAVENFDSTLKHFVANGGKVYRGPLEIEDGRFICQIVDPFGNAIGLIGRRVRS